MELKTLETRSSHVFLVWAMVRRYRLLHHPAHEPAQGISQSIIVSDPCNLTPCTACAILYTFVLPFSSLLWHLKAVLLPFCTEKMR
jgi:hypothetical protein